MSELDAAKPATDPTVVAALTETRQEFLRFVERRVESTPVAEEILQSAFVKMLEKGAEVRDTDNAVAWFYSILRNAIVDHYRRRGTQSRALAREAQLQTRDLDEQTKTEVCGCMRRLIPTLKSEYAEILAQVDLEERSLPDVAAAASITTNNAAVRLHRARQALKKQLEKSCGVCATHGCLNCSCDQ